jgi:hypothetical protein
MFYCNWKKTYFWHSGARRLCLPCLHCCYATGFYTVVRGVRQKKRKWFVGWGAPEGRGPRFLEPAEPAIATLLHLGANKGQVIFSGGRMPLDPPHRLHWPSLICEKSQNSVPYAYALEVEKELRRRILRCRIVIYIYIYIYICNPLTLTITPKDSFQNHTRMV